MATYTVSTKAELETALSQASGSDKIVLKSGEYGALKLTQDFSSEVTITSETLHGAHFDSIDFVGATNIRIDGISATADSGRGAYEGTVRVDGGSKGVTVANSDLSGQEGKMAGIGIVATKSADVTLEGNYVHHVSDGVVFIDVDDIEVVSNKIDYIANDSFKFNAVDGALIAYNFGAEHRYPSSDAHADFIQFQIGTSHNVVLRGNVFIPAEGTNGRSQGIFIADQNDGPPTNFLIEGNILMTGAPRGISINGENVTIRDNTILHPPGWGYDVSRIWADGAVVENNIWTNEKGGTEGSNIVVQHLDPSGTNYVGDLFTDFHGTGTSLDGLIPEDGSIIDGKGAYDYLVALLAGETPDLTGPDSVPSTPTEPEAPTEPSTPTEPETPTEPTTPTEPDTTPSGGEILYGDGGDNVLRGTEMGDQLSGRNGDDVLVGEGGDDHLKGHGGHDELYGGEGNDRVNGGGGRDHMQGGFGNDRLNGKTGQDKLLGGAGNDILQGRRGDDTLDGGEGNDRIDGGRGNDILTGGSGSDVFAFRLSPGDDIITDFEDGTDLIDLTRFNLSSNDLAEVLNTSLSETNGDAVLDMAALGTEGSLLLKGIDVTELNESDFIL